MAVHSNELEWRPRDTAEMILVFPLTIAIACVTSESPGASLTDIPETSEASTAPDDDPAGTSAAPGVSSGSTTPVDDDTGISTGTAANMSTGGEEVAPECGDGIVQPETEECDHGADNDALAECTGECKWNFCGDGNKHEGVEQCDLGDANSDIPHCGGCIAGTCKLGPYCGDNTLNPECGEICDGGKSPNGLACAETCRLKTAKFVFVTPGTYTGDLTAYTNREVDDGVDAADWICHDLADAAGLVPPPAENDMPHQQPQFRAWISSGEKPVDGRLNTSHTGEYVTRKGTIVAIGWNGLTDGALDTPIMGGPTLADPVMGALVWTNTRPDGSLNAIDLSCINWMSDGDAEGAIGVSGSVEAWTYVAGDDGKAFCSADRRLYCIEQ